MVRALLAVLNADAGLRQWAGRAGPVAIRWAAFRRTTLLPVVLVQGMPDLRAVQVTARWAFQAAAMGHRTALEEAVRGALTLAALRREGLPLAALRIEALALDDAPETPTRADWQVWVTF